MTVIDVITTSRVFNDSENSFDRIMMDLILDNEDKNTDFRVINFELGYTHDHHPAIRAFIELGNNTGKYTSYVFSEITSPQDNIITFLKALKNELGGSGSFHPGGSPTGP